MDTTVEVTLPVDANAAKVLNSPARREAAGRYLSELLRGGRIRNVLAGRIAEASARAEQAALWMRTPMRSLRHGATSVKLECRL